MKSIIFTDDLELLKSVITEPHYVIHETSSKSVQYTKTLLDYTSLVSDLISIVCEYANNLQFEVFESNDVRTIMVSTPYYMVRIVKSSIIDIQLCYMNTYIFHRKWLKKYTNDAIYTSINDLIEKYMRYEYGIKNAVCFDKEYFLRINKEYVYWYEDIKYTYQINDKKLFEEMISICLDIYNMLKN